MTAEVKGSAADIASEDVRAAFPDPLVLRKVIKGMTLAKSPGRLEKRHSASLIARLRGVAANITQGCSDESAMVHEVVKRGEAALVSQLEEILKDVDPGLREGVRSGVVDAYRACVDEIIEHYEQRSGLGSGRLNALGLPMHPKEIEVADMIELAKQGDQVKPRYVSRKRGGDWDNPIDYLKAQYGTYLARFNEEKADFIFQDELRLIDPRFVDALKSYLYRHGQERLAEYVPTVSSRTERDLRVFESLPISEKSRYRKLHSLQTLASRK